jgi:hypothetical protein
MPAAASYERTAWGVSLRDGGDDLDMRKVLSSILDAERIIWSRVAAARRAR